MMLNVPVLVEEFTGQKCINCPEAHEELAKIQKEYGEDNVISVCIHASALAVAPLKQVLAKNILNIGMAINFHVL